VSLTLAVSEVDGAALTGLASGARVAAIPTGVDTAYFHPNGFREQPAGLAFVGSMDWYPNEDAVLHVLDAIWPRVRNGMPEASFTVVGRNPSARLRAAAASLSGVTFTGTVDDVRPEVGRAAVCVVPLRIGGGTRLKILEALAMAKAVVATPIGAEGLPLVDGQHFVAAETPEDFAAAVLSLLRDPARRAALGTCGRRLVEQRHSWAQVAREFEERLKEGVA
jgi:glycosyltransferase involved in cell wall biosynthesis